MESRLEFIEVRGERPQQPLCRAVIDGLAARQKSLPTHFLYDRAGSELFERITELPEYYPTRTERSILEANAPHMIEAAGEGAALVEFGSGSSAKTRLLLEAAMARQPELKYVPIDISADFLRSTAQTLLSEYPRLRVTALAAEYFDAIDALPAHDGPRLILFLGSNIGNMTHAEAADFLGRVRARMEPQDRILLGVDLVKDRAILEAAYNDAQGVTGLFNRNVLHRINRELNGHFDVECFRHHAPYDERMARIEMRLHSVGEQHVAVDDVERTFDFADGEYIHTEWSHKYTRETFAALCAPAGLEIAEAWRDPREWFAMMMLRPNR